MAEARIISLAAVQTCLGLGCGLVLLLRGKKIFNKEYWGFALKFNLPLLCYYLSQSVLNQSDRIMINYFCGSGKAAVYSVAYTAGTLMLLAVSAIMGAFSPWMYRKLKAKEYSQVVPAAGRLTLLMAAATLVMTVFAPDLVAILATDSYREAIWIIPPVSASVFFVFVYMLFANVEMFYDGNRGISYISVVCTLVNVVLNWWAIPRYGYLAAGWTTLASYLLLTLLHYVLMRRRCREQGVEEKIFPVGKMLLISLLVLAATFGMMALYSMGWVRYAVVLVEGALVWLFRKKIFAMIGRKEN
jgi:O-antigen/teichoic acid export membrane protein